MKYLIEPVPKPRMTQRDRWKKRSPVLRYHAFRDEVRARKVKLSACDGVIFHLPMPTSWSERKREAMRGKAHQSKPDVDNLAKALLDALYGEDSHVALGVYLKLWADVGMIEIVQARRVIEIAERLDWSGMQAA